MKSGLSFAQRDPHVLLTWGVSSYFGWGVYGLNLLLAWADREDLKAATLAPMDGVQIDVDPLELARLRPALERSMRAQNGLKAVADGHTKVKHLVLQTINNELPLVPVAHGAVVRGKVQVGVAFLEQAELSAGARERLREFPMAVAGSSWNKTVMERAGAQRVELVLQGVDTSHFHPAPRRELFPGRFVVFSGGKLEFRKGQDLVVRAFRIFAERHSDALLLTAWGSPWPGSALTIGDSEGLAAPGLTAEGQLDAAGWTARNGIAERQTVHCGPVPNRAMARILREADVALFPNRAEGGTNLVAMECIACGVPTIVSANTGHLDLVEGGMAMPLIRQGRLEAREHLEWGESDVEEMVEALEAVYRDRGVRVEAAARMGEWSWKRQMERLGDLLVEYLPGS